MRDRHVFAADGTWEVRPRAAKRSGLTRGTKTSGDVNLLGHRIYYSPLLFRRCMPRTVQTARKSTGGKAPSKLALNAAKNNSKAPKKTTRQSGGRQQKLRLTRVNADALLSSSEDEGDDDAEDNLQQQEEEEEGQEQEEGARQPSPLLSSMDDLSAEAAAAAAAAAVAADSNLRTPAATTKQPTKQQQQQQQQQRTDGGQSKRTTSVIDRTPLTEAQPNALKTPATIFAKPGTTAFDTSARKRTSFATPAAAPVPQQTSVRCILIPEQNNRTSQQQTTTQQRSIIREPQMSLKEFRNAVRQAFGADLLPQATAFTLVAAEEESRKIMDDDALGDLRANARLFVLVGRAGTSTDNNNVALGAPVSEPVSFEPHPKTMTMAGDYEYFSSGGTDPYPFAVAELVDNALRAVRIREEADGPGACDGLIDVSFVQTGADTALICVQDNGCGMGPYELRDWAVMNLSMEDRGSCPQEPPSPPRLLGTQIRGCGPSEKSATQGGAASNSSGPEAVVEQGIARRRRFLTCNLSYFGVGSKNSVFYLGGAVKVVTKPRGSAYVHELCLSASELERNYLERRNGGGGATTGLATLDGVETAYRTELVHRDVGDASTLSEFERRCGVAERWVANESTMPCFTRVVIEVSGANKHARFATAVGRDEGASLRTCLYPRRGVARARGLRPGSSPQ